MGGINGVQVGIKGEQGEITGLWCGIMGLLGEIKVLGPYGGGFLGGLRGVPPDPPPPPPPRWSPVPPRPLWGEGQLRFVPRSGGVPEQTPQQVRGRGGGWGSLTPLIPPQPHSLPPTSA